jgi:hypothetical protein
MNEGHGLWGTIVGAIVLVAAFGLALRRSGNISTIVGQGVNPSISKVAGTFSSQGQSLGG